MCKIRAKTLGFFPSFLLATMCIVAPAPVNSEPPKDYFENFLVTPEISFAHISNTNSESSNNNDDGRWTKEHKCNFGSFATKQAWIFNETQGNILGFAAQCTKTFAEKADTNQVKITTFPSEQRIGPSVKIIELQNEDKDFAVGFAMSTWTEGDRVSIGYRQLITDGRKTRNCTGRADNCINYDFRCKNNFAICGFQAKIVGGNGTLGGSITRMRFRCCNHCSPTEPETRYYWNTSSSNSYRQQVYKHEGSYGYRSIDAAQRHWEGTSNVNSAPLPVCLKNTCGSLNVSPYNDHHACYKISNGRQDASPEDYYPSYSDEITEQPGECEEPEAVIDITGSFNASAHTWDSIMKRIFKDAPPSSSGARRRRASQNSMGFPTETRPYDKTMGELLKHLSGFKHVGTEGLPSKGKNETQTETFVCEPGHSCTVRQIAWSCGNYHFENPAVLVADALPSNSATILQAVSNTVEHVPMLPNYRDTGMLDTTLKSEAEGHLHFIFNYGPSGKETELLCPTGSVATGMRVKSEQGLGMTGLEMECSHLTVNPTLALYTKSKTLRVELPTETGKWESQKASNSAPITGFYFNWSKGIEPFEGAKVSFGALTTRQDATPYDETKFCPEDQAICGFSYMTERTDRTDIKPDVIKKSKLKCCTHCFPQVKWDPLELPDSGEKIGERLRIQVGLVDKNSSKKRHAIGFGTRSRLQALIASRFGSTINLSRASFRKLRIAPVRRPKCLKETDPDGKGRCEFQQLAITCGPYKVYTAQVEQVGKSVN